MDIGATTVILSPMLLEFARSIHRFQKRWIWSSVSKVMELGTFAGGAPPFCCSRTSTTHWILVLQQWFFHQCCWHLCALSTSLNSVEFGALWPKSLSFLHLLGLSHLLWQPSHRHNSMVANLHLLFPLSTFQWFQPSETIPALFLSSWTVRWKTTKPRHCNDSGFGSFGSLDLLDLFSRFPMAIPTICY